MNLTAREIVSGTVEVASLPEVFIRINEMVENPHYSASDIGRVISRDPAMTARLLKIVNSPFYNFPSKIDTVSRAITIIGVRELRDLVLATTVVKLFAGIPNDLVSMDSFWRHSTLCAVVARQLGARNRELNVERFFIAGLLHDIGSLLIYRKIPELAREALLRASHNDEVLESAERGVMGFSHADVGGELMRKWRLPKNIEDAVEHHLRPSNCPGCGKEVAVVHLANIIASAVWDSSSEPMVVPPLDPTAWEVLDLSPRDIDPVVTEAERQYDEIFTTIFTDNVVKRSAN
jgi:putative nucleotidyltransferase with HDIG domain